MKSGSNNFFKYIFVVVIIVLVCGAVYILYSQKSNSENEEEEENGVLKTTDMSLAQNIKIGVAGYDTMNPILTRNREIINIDRLIFEPLVNITSDYRVEACLAKSCNKKTDTSYEIKLDSSIKWQDGSNLIAKDVEFTIEMIKQTNSIYSSNVQAIESVEIPDSETVIVNLSKPITFFEYNLTFPIISSMYYTNEDFQNSSKIPIGTGMYKIASIDSDNIMIVRNDRWRNLKTAAPKTQSILLKKYNAVGEIFNAFKLGNVDTINTYKSNYTDYVGTIGYNKREYVGRDYEFISLNCSDAILSDVSVRKAINYAINKDNIVGTALGGAKVVANSPLDYGSYLYNADGKIDYSPDLAKQTLEEGGWYFANERWQKSINGYVRKINLSLVVSKDNGERVNVANNIKGQLADVGIGVNVIQVDSNKYNEYLNNKNYQMILTGVTSSVNPELSYFYGEGNIANYHNEDVIGKINNIDNYAEIQKVANEEVPYIGLYRDKGTIILNSNVGGDFSPNSYFIYYNFEKWYRQQ